PGIPMEAAEISGYSKLTIDIGDANRAEVAFNNGYGAWDSNNMNNYFFDVGSNTYEPGVNGSYGSVKKGLPDGIDEGDSIAPSKPTNLSATATEDSVSLNWTAATDNVGVTGYKIYRDGEEIDTTTS